MPRIKPVDKQRFEERLHEYADKIVVKRDKSKGADRFLIDHGNGVREVVGTSSGKHNVIVTGKII